jgi:hypothetical protein
MKKESLSKVDPLHSDAMYVMGVAFSLALPVLALMVWPSAKSSAYLADGPAVAAEQAASTKAVVANAESAGVDVVHPTTTK